MDGDAADEERFDRLWREHAAEVLAYARRRVDAEQADEVVAETFVVAWRRLGEVPEAARPWLFGVARKVAANVRRGKRRRDALHDRLAEEQRAGAPGPGTEPAGLAGPALAELPADDRELLMLLAWDGLSRSEAAAALGCSRATLAVRLHRARQRLKTAMKRLADDIDDIRPPGREQVREPSRDSGRESCREPGRASERDSGREPRREADRDSSREPRQEADREPRWESDREPRRESDREPGRGADRETGRTSGRGPGQRVPGARTAETFPATAPGGPR